MTQTFPSADQAFVELIDDFRRLQASMSGCRPSAEASARAAHHIAEASKILEPFETDEDGQYFGRSDVDGRAQALSPPLRNVSYVDGHGAATISFSRFYLGGGSAVHGGALPLVFDELLGRLAGSVAGVRLRTAYLKVDYRAITPLNRDLQMTGQLERRNGRKLFITGALRDGGRLLCEVDSMFLTLLPGQP